MRVAVIIASRGRPELLARTLKTLGAGMSLPETRCSVALDGDDPELSACLNAIERREAYPALTISIGDREDSLGAKYNRAYRAAQDPDLAVLWADDMVMPEPGWDAKLAEAAEKLPDRCGCVFFGDIPGILQPGVAVSRKFVEAMGFFCVPYFPAWWHETYTIECAHMSRSFAYADVRVELLQEVAGKSRGIRDIAFWGRLFDDLRPERASLARRIIEESNLPQADRDEALTNMPILIEGWRLSNAGLRDPVRAKQLEEHYGYDNEPTDRYTRLRMAAEKMMGEMP